MPALAREQSSDCTNPVLDIFTAVSGVLTDVEVLEFQIFEKVTTPGTPVQVFPATPGDREPVDVTTLCPTGDKISTGRYVAKWTVPISEPIGTHEIRWFFKLTATSNEQTAKEEFEVLASVTASFGEGYCSIADLRAEGVTVAMADDAFLQERIALASRMIDQFTGRFFDNRTLSFTLDGSGQPSMHLEQPIVAISDVFIDDVAFLSSDIIVYNRHISENLRYPNDADNPRIEIRQPLDDDLLFKIGLKKFPEGQQNIRIDGLFGYREHDGSSEGRVPLMICWACKLLTIRNIAKLADLDGVSTYQNAWRITELKTRDQTIKWAAASGTTLGRRGVGRFTGDPEIDTILMGFRRPPTMRSV